MYNMLCKTAIVGYIADITRDGKSRELGGETMKENYWDYANSFGFFYILAVQTLLLTVPVPFLN